jgi:hypothetical protein
VGLRWSLFIFLCAQAFRAEAGISPRRASHFLVRDKKVTKETRLPTASGGTRYALAALRSDSRLRCEGLLSQNIHRHASPTAGMQAIGAVYLALLKPTIAYSSKSTHHYLYIFYSYKRLLHKVNSHISFIFS